MSNLVLILLLFAGLVVLFTLGWLVSHITRLDKHYNEMMNNGGNISDTK